MSPIFFKNVIAMPIASLLRWREERAKSTQHGLPQRARPLVQL
jgi:hypothetical protein